jgi:hypothetical protein
VKPKLYLEPVGNASLLASIRKRGFSSMSWRGGHENAERSSVNEHFWGNEATPPWERQAGLQSSGKVVAGWKLFNGRAGC